MDTKTFDSVKIGERVGFVTGPGEFPKDNVAKVVAKVTDRWGNHLKVKFGDGREDTVHTFTKVGIGAYRLDA